MSLPPISDTARTVTRDEGNAVADVARNVRGVDKVVKVFNYMDET